MRDFSLPEPVDLITCEYDALNHVPRHSDLRRVIRAAARNLRPGGYFAFDVNNLRAFQTVWKNTWVLDKDPVVLIMENGHDNAKQRAWSNVQFFVKKGARYERYHERVEEICWEPTEIRDQLQAAGFHQIRTWDAAPFFQDVHTYPGNRTFWRARKPPN